MMCGNVTVLIRCCLEVILILTSQDVYLIDDDALILLADICMIRSDSKKDGTSSGGAYAFNNALLALWLVVLGNDAYMAK